MQHKLNILIRHAFAKGFEAGTIALEGETTDAHAQAEWIDYEPPRDLYEAVVAELNRGE